VPSAPLLLASGALIHAGRRRLAPVLRDGGADHPNVIVVFVVGLAKPPPVTDDRPVAAKRAQPKEKLQRDLDHQNHGGREGRPKTVLPSSNRRPAFTLLIRLVKCRRKENTAFSLPARPLPQGCKIGRYMRHYRQFRGNRGPLHATWACPLRGSFLSALARRDCVVSLLR
jgi:hypothetical protein